MKKENGYFSVYNDIWDALTKTYQSDAERRCIGVIIRKTWGYKKTKDHIAYSQFAKEAGLSRRGAIKAIKNLVYRKIVTSEQTDTSDINLYCLNKNFKEWVLVNKCTPGEQTGKLLVNKQTPTINNIQKTKEINKESSKQEPVKTNRPDYKREAEKFIEAFNSLFSSNYRLTDDRKGKFIKRRQVYSAAEIMSALDRLSESDWHQGKDPNSKGWKADPDFLLRNDNQIDVWLNKSVKEVERPTFDNPPELMKFAKKHGNKTE